jgi:PAS domain S-box-containing protein
MGNSEDTHNGIDNAVFFDMLDAPVVFLDRDFTMRFTNKAFLEKTGYASEELAGASFETLLPEGDRPGFRQTIGRLGRPGGLTADIDHELTHKNGRPEKYRTSAAAGTLPDGQPVVMLRLECVTDMLREKNNLETLRALYIAVAEQASEAFFMHDITGRILDVNRCACEKLGYTREELLSMSISDVDTHLRAGETPEEWLQIKPGETYVFHGRHRRRDGTEIPVDVNFGCTVIGREKIFLGLATDLTDLRKAERKYKTIVEAAPEPIFIQTDGNFAYLNPAACAFFGISSPEQLVGTPVCNSFAPEYRPIIQERIRRLNEDRLPVKDFQEYRFTGKNGDVWGETTGVPFEYEGKNGALVFLRDVTQRKQAEAEMLASRRKYEKLFSGAAVPVLVEQLPERRIVDVNEAWIQLFGYTKEEAVGHSAVELGISDNYLSDDEIAALIRTDQTARNLETTHRTKSGEEHIMLTSVSFTEHDGVHYAMVTHQDITERMRADRFSRIVMDNLTIGIAVNTSAPPLSFCYMNDKFPQFYRTTREALEGEDVFFDAVYEDPEFREEIRARVLEDMQSGDPRRMRWENVPITRRGQETRYISAYNTPVPEGDMHISVVIDETERVRTLEALRLNAARLQAIHEFDLAILGGFESLFSIGENALRYIDRLLEPDMIGVAILGLDDKVLHVVKSDRGQGTSEKYEIPVDNLELAQLSAISDTISRTGGEKPPAVVAKIFKCQGLGCGYHIPVITTGRFRGIISIGYIPPRELPSENIVTLQEMVTRVALAIEATRLLQVTERYATNLEQMIQERTAELEEANRELESFTFSVSHDLRAPLRSMNGFVRILLEDYGHVLDDEGRRICGVIADSARSMGQLIDDLLSLSRVGRSALQLTKVDMRALVLRAYTELTTEEQREAIEFTVGDLPYACADLHLIRQVWVNLLDNAVKFSSKNPKPKIRVTARISGDETVYAVEDNGAGFDMAYQDKLFGVFQRLHSQKEYPGTGVGLAIVSRIVRRHGGRVWARGEEGAGAVFYFSLKREGGGDEV